MPALRSIGPLSEALIAISGVTTPTSRARIMMISLPTRSWSYSSNRNGRSSLTSRSSAGRNSSGMSKATPPMRM